MNDLMKVWSHLVLSLILTGLTSDGKTLKTCTCSCFEVNNDEPSPPISIQGDYCDTDMRMRPEMRKTINCENHPVAKCSSGESLLLVKKDFCTCVATSSLEIPFCKCRGRRYEDVRRREQIRCSCAEVTDEITWSSDGSSLNENTHDIHALVPANEKIATTSRPVNSEDIEGVRPVNTTSEAPAQGVNSTASNISSKPTVEHKKNFNVVVIIGVTIPAVIILLIAVFVGRKLCKNNKKHKNIEIRYESSFKAEDSQKMANKLQKKQSSGESVSMTYAPVSTSSDNPMYSETNQTPPPGYATPDSNQNQPAAYETPINRHSKSPATSTGAYDVIEDQLTMPRAPARIPAEYHYITPAVYAQPYSDVMIDKDDKVIDEESVNKDDVEPYIEFLPS